MSGGSSSSSGDSNSDLEIQALQKVLEELPSAFDLPKILEKYPTSYLESMNTVLTQESTRFNNLLRLITKTLNDTIKVLRGEILKTRFTDAVRAGFKINAVPDFWLTAAWPSLLNLSSWLVDLKARFLFIGEWTESGKCPIVWFSGFFYPQAFITGTL